MLRLVIWPSLMFLGWTLTKLWILKYGSKSIQTSLILRQRPPKPYKLLKFFMISVIVFKMVKHSDFHLSFFQIEVAWRDFTVVTKRMKNFKSLYGLGDTVSKLETFVWIFKQMSRSITSSLFILKVPNLVNWPVSTWSFMWWCQFIDWLKFETRPSSLLNFGTAYDPCLAWLAANLRLDTHRLDFMTKTHTSYPIWPPCDKGEFRIIAHPSSNQLKACSRVRSWTSASSLVFTTLKLVRAILLQAGKSRK